MKVEIQRVENGWIVIETGGWEDTPTTSVFEDAESKGEALCHALQSAFMHHTQSKRMGGVLIGYAPHGTELKTEE